MTRTALVALVLAGCSYKAQLADCTVTCAADLACPDDFACRAGRCHPDDAPSTCELPTGTFAAAVTYPAGNGATFVVVADVDGDGAQDLAVVNGGEADVGVLLGHGDGTFAPQHVYPVQTSPNALAVGDFNGDGHPDLVASNSGADSVSVLLNLGDGTFDVEPPVSVGALPSWLAVGDLDGDGHLDVAVANMNDTSITVLIGDGLGGLTPQPAIVLGARPYAIAIADLDGDGLRDVVETFGEGNTFGVEYGQGGGVLATLGLAPAGANPFALAIGDVDGDGRADVVVTNYLSADVSVVHGLLLPTGPTFEAAQPYPVSDVPEGVAIGDLDGDSLPDLAVANLESHSASILLNTGDASAQFATAVTYDVAGKASSLAIGDFNHDSVPDVVVTNQENAGSVSVLLGIPAQ